MESRKFYASGRLKGGGENHIPAGSVMLEKGDSFYWKSNCVFFIPEMIPCGIEITFLQIPVC